MFTLYPAIGTVPAGGVVQITIDMIAENPGFSEEVSVLRLYLLKGFKKGVIRSQQLDNVN